MSDEKKILYPCVQSERGCASNHADFIFWCPGCNEAHGVWTTKRNGLNAVWGFNGDMEKPTFTPSIKITGTQPITDAEHDKIMAGEKVTPRPYCCHSYVVNGSIQFLGDCTHHLRGQTVPLPKF